MATVNVALNPNATTHSSRHGKTRMPYLVEAYVDMAAVTTAKGGAIAAADVIQCITVPAQTALLYGGLEVITATDAGAADLTLEWGYGGDDDLFVVAMDCDSGSAAGSVSAGAATNFAGLRVTTAQDTLDLVTAGTGVDVTTGVIRCWALVLDISDHSNDIPAADRDYLA